MEEIVHTELIEGYRLSPQQRHVWLLKQETNSEAFRAYCVLQILGQSDPEYLKDALQRMTDRHEILRTTFQAPVGVEVPLQAVSQARPYIIEYDLSADPFEERESRSRGLFQDVIDTPFDLAQGPVVRACTIVMSPTDRRLLIALPALCADKTALNNIVSELSREYGAPRNPSPTVRETIQYADLSEVFNELLESQNEGAGKVYWRECDTSSLAAVKIPFERELHEKEGFDPRYITLKVTAAVRSGIEAVASRYGASVYVSLLACWITLLWRLSDCPQLTVAAAVDGRAFEGLNEAVGLFLKYVPVGSQLDGQANFTEILHQVNESLLEARDQQDYFDWKEISDRPGKGFTFGDKICFDYERRHSTYLQELLTFRILELYHCVDQFKINLVCVQEEDWWEFELHFDAGSYREEDIRRLGEQLLSLIGDVTRSPEKTIGRLSIIGDQERHQVLAGFNNTQADLQDCRLHGLLERRVKGTPHHVAVSLDNQHLTYLDLNRRANQLAAYLRRKGVGPESLVGLLLNRSIEMLIAIVAVLKAGGAYVPLDPSYPAHRLAYMLADSGTEMLITEQQLIGAIDKPPREIIYLDKDRIKIEQEHGEDFAALVSSENAAYVIYTSGSTGNPKGVAISHRAINNHMQWSSGRFAFNEHDRLIQKTSFCFDASVWEFFAPLNAGATLVMAPPGAHQDSRALITEITMQQVTILQVVPTMLRVILNESEIVRCVSLKHVFCGGDLLTPDLCERLSATLLAELINFYGPTETTINATCWLCDGEGREKNIPIGWPLANTQIYLVDGEGAQSPFGMVGEVYIGGDQLARGYLGKPGLTAEMFIPNPFSAQGGARLYRSGDLAQYRRDGTLEYIGRKDLQVKLHGYRIEMGEIEAVLRGYPGVREAVVALREYDPTSRRLRSM
jgi:amino acid adenylation domain-containing protein